MADMPAVSVLIQVPPVFLIFARSSRARVEQSIPGRKDGFPKVKVIVRRLLRHRRGLTWCYSLDFLGTAGQRQLRVLQRS